MAYHDSQNNLCFLEAKCKVFLPVSDMVTMPRDNFEAFVAESVKPHQIRPLAVAQDVASGDETGAGILQEMENLRANSEEPGFPEVIMKDSDGTQASDSELLIVGEKDVGEKDVGEKDGDEKDAKAPVYPFMEGLYQAKVEEYESTDNSVAETLAEVNKMFTENAGTAHRSTKNPLVDLFYELEEVIDKDRPKELLDQAWAEDKVTTLKIIFNARSIHLGKSSRLVFYRCAGWLAENHPRTLLANLRWLSRPVIQKKIEPEKDDSEKNKKVDGDDTEKNKIVNENNEDDFVMTELADADPNNPARFDVRNGVAHGYWKDLLNLVVLAAEDQLHALANPRAILNIERQHSSISKAEAKDKREAVRVERHGHVFAKLAGNPTYAALYYTVARLFAEQLQEDMDRLATGDTRVTRNISLCAKWAPSTDRFHDKHTFIVSTIAEILFPASTFEAGIIPDTGNPDTDKPDTDKPHTDNLDTNNPDADNHNTNNPNADREVYLRHAREKYRKAVSKLRTHLQVVERNLSANTLALVDYERVPSVAMNNYAPIFATKDTARFEAYIDRVTQGKARISGATLLPSTLVHGARMYASSYAVAARAASKKGAKGTKGMIEQQLAALQAKTADGQWCSLVQRIRDSGSLENSMAVCDVSGSMGGPQFPDGTCPMDSAIGLSLLLAEVTAPPFGGAFITFSERPEVQKIDVGAPLSEKVSAMERSSWSMNTDFEAVFTKLILPMAVKNKVKKEDMVKCVFVFSDMQFDSARYGSADPWATAYERINKQFKEKGYDTPELVFWNLAGGRAGYGYYLGGYPAGDPVAPKPVTALQEGTALVSGYSQGMLKVFLEKGLFERGEDEEDEEEAEVVDVEEDSEEDGEEHVVFKKQKIDPLSTVLKAVGHRAYRMLVVMD